MKLLEIALTWLSVASQRDGDRRGSHLGVLRAHAHSWSDLLVNHYVDLYTLFSLALQKSVESPFREMGGGSPEIQLRGQPPILRRVSPASKRRLRTTHQDKDGLFGVVQHL